MRRMAHQVLIFCCACLIAFGASEKWRKKDPVQWSAQDVETVLQNSPWAQQANVKFADPSEDVERDAQMPLPGPAQAGMAGPRAATDGRWDGGVARNPRGGVPVLSVLIRWDSADPVVRAFAKQAALDSTAQPDMPAPAAIADKDYVISIMGLVPAGRYKPAGQLQRRSESDESFDARDPEEMLEGIMSTSRLVVRGRRPIEPEDVKLDAATGILHLYFPRSAKITQDDREVLFATRFGSMKLQKSFDLKAMIFNGKLAL
jgi:hypothetical protein